MSKCAFGHPIEPGKFNCRFGHAKESYPSSSTINDEADTTNLISTVIAAEIVSDAFDSSSTDTSSGSDSFSGGGGDFGGGGDTGSW